MNIYQETMYQIYPIGFCGAPKQNDGIITARIRKIAEWSDHLEKLGIGSIILNPIFESDYHGYDTRDYLTIDCRLGSNDDFTFVCNKLHKAGIKVILDGVFNHVGRGFWAFQDVLKNRDKSNYKDWFYLNFDGNNAYNDQLWYEGWEGHFELVKLNLKNPCVVNHLLDCVKFWIEEFEIDGLRLDVAYSLDHDFLRSLRSFCKVLKPDFCLIGEVLFGDYNQIVNEDMLDSCTNYEVYKGIHSSFNSINMFEISYSLNRQYGNENWCLYRGKHLMNFVDNHDVTRIASILTNDKHLPLVYGMLFTIPGIPCIYYGSEWGVRGEKTPQNDYDLRPNFKVPEWNNLTTWIQTLSAIFERHEALSNGSFTNILVTNQQYIYERKTDKQRILIAINSVDQPYQANHGAVNGTFIDLTDANSKQLNLTGTLRMPPYSIQILKEV